MGVAIQTELLTKIYDGRVIAVNDMSFRVPTGAVYGLLGPNGAGKTTTLRVLLGLQRPSAGFAQVFGHSCGPGATNVRAMIGYLPTHPVLPGHLCPIEYLELLGKLCQIPIQIRKPRLTSLLRAVGLLVASVRLFAESFSVAFAQVVYGHAFQRRPFFGNIKCHELSFLKKFYRSLTGWTTERAPVSNEAQGSLFPIREIFLENYVREPVSRWSHIDSTADNGELIGLQIATTDLIAVNPVDCSISAREINFGAIKSNAMTRANIKTIVPI